MPVLSDISLYIPARNGEATLTACLDAVARLEPAPARVLVVADPKSSDQTVAIAEAHDGCDVVQQRRRGLTGARNEAYAALTTPWIAAVDCDVVIAPDWLGHLAEARAHFPRAVGISARTEERITGVADLWRALMHPHHWGAHPMSGPFMIVSEAIMRRDAVVGVGGYRESLQRYGDDSRLCRDLRDAGHELAYWPFARGVHVRHDDPRSVLDLRWDYGAPRMGPLMDDLAGLRQKLDKNLEFARLAVRRGLDAGAPQLALVGALLPIHHGLRDLRTMLERRRLPDVRVERAVEALRDVMIASVRSWPALARLAAKALGMGTSDPVGLDWPAWDDFVGHQRAILGRWVLEARAAIGVEVPDATAAQISDWAARYGGHAHPWAEGDLWHRPRALSPWLAEGRPERIPANQQTQRSASTDRHSLYDGRPVTVLTASLERPTIFGATAVEHVRHPEALPPSPGVVSIPALGEWTHPRSVLREALASADAAVVRYRPPARIEAGEMLMAGDIAEACAAAGMAIVGFETIVGETVIAARRHGVELTTLASAA